MYRTFLYRQSQYRHDFQVVFLVVISHSAGLGIGKVRTVGLDLATKSVGINPVKLRKNELLPLNRTGELAPLKLHSARLKIGTN